MNAGRELDVLVAEKVMGWRGSSEKHYVGNSGKCFCCGIIPPYSTSIAAAWEVVEKMFYLGWDLELQYFKKNDKEYTVRVLFAEIGNQELSTLAFADTAPHAICLAALEAVGVELKDE